MSSVVGVKEMQDKLIMLLQGWCDWFYKISSA
jgi:hypothetical protein